MEKTSTGSSWMLFILVVIPVLIPAIAVEVYPIQVFTCFNVILEDSLTNTIGN